MICHGCKRSGYSFAKTPKGPWCGSCEGGGTRTLGSPGMYQESNSGSGIMTESNSGSYNRNAGSISQLPKLCNLNEWTEIIKLCRSVSRRRSLTEDAPEFKSIPLPGMKNPLDERPSDKQAGWSPLDEYFKALDKPKSDLRNLFEG